MECISSRSFFRFTGLLRKELRPSGRAALIPYLRAGDNWPQRDDPRLRPARPGKPGKPGKRRFETRNGLIRAAQGHSFPVNLGLRPQLPPAVLYHGTVARFLDSILAEGLRPGRRTHVHLSADQETAATVGARRGRPVILLIDAALMQAGGHEFFRAANGVWLTAHVPPAFISRDAGT